MSKIKFEKSKTIYDCIFSSLGPNQVRLEFISDMPDKDTLYSGFSIVNEYNGEVMSKMTDYVYKYRDTEQDNVVELDNDGIGWTEPEPPIIIPEPEPVPEPEEIIPELSQVIDEKIAEFSTACKMAIESGVTLMIDDKPEHFSYSLIDGDQSNIDDIFQTMITTGMPQYYHSDGNPCKLYTLDQVFQLYAAEKANKLENTTYHNLVSIQIRKKYENAENTKEVREEIQGLYYKSVKLEDKYLQRYQEILTDGTALINTYKEKLAALLQQQAQAEQEAQKASETQAASK